MVEHLVCNQGVIGSSPFASTMRARTHYRGRDAAGAKGLMQLIDSTASDMNVKNVFKARDNIIGGAKYLKKMLDRFGELKLALAAYNAGPENVKKYGDIPPFAETKAYVGRVMDNITEYKNNNNNMNEVEM